MRYAYLFLIVAMVACAPPRRSVLEGAPAVDVDDARSALTMPPDSDSAAALKQLEAVARRGDVRAAWVVAHYLVDLFDAARFESDAERRDQARTLLFTAVDMAPGQGPITTNAVLDVLLVKVDRVLGLDRLHAGAQAARTLLDFDRKKPARTELFARMVSLKAIARGSGPLRANASLRLADFCREAFRDAARAPTPYRPGILTYCLYPLFDSDPEPYFEADVGKRPPPPAWQDLAAATARLYAEIGKSKSRIAILGGELTTEDTQFFKAKQTLMPAAPQPADLGVPMLARAEPYVWTPLVRLGDGSKPPAADLGAKLSPIVAADGRARVAVALTASAPATTAIAAAQAAAQAGADTLELVVGYEQTVKAPSGDYWHSRAKGDKVARLGVISLALDPLATAAGKTTAGPDAGHAAPRATDWDPARATLGLHVIVSPGMWRLVAPGGALAEIPSAAGAAPEKALRAELARVRSAFPDEDGIVVVPEAGASYADLVAAADAARSDAAGKPLFGALALGSRRPTVAAKGDLSVRITRRSQAEVAIVPDALAGRAPAVRQCYQDALDQSARLVGVVAIELRQPVKSVPAAAQVISGPGDKPFKACLTQAIGPAMVSGTIQSARLTLSVRSH